MSLIFTQARPKVPIVEPLDYEGELILRRKDLEKEQFLNLILFPQQDVTVSQSTITILPNVLLNVLPGEHVVRWSLIKQYNVQCSCSPESTKG